MSLWVPPAVSRELRESTQEHNEATLSMFYLDQGVCVKWNKESSPLRKFDPLMRVGKAKPSADPTLVVPGYYHLIRINPGAPLTAMPLHVRGEFVEPGEWMIDLLRSMDLQNPQVTREREERKRKQEAQAEKDKLDKRAMRDEKLMEAWRAHDRPKFNFDPEVKWTNSTDGKRGRKVD
jgi:hypothetical protein